MRFLLALVGLAALIVAVMIAFGWMTLDTRAGSLPSLHVEAGTAPSVKANVGKVTMGTENKTIEVPTVTTTEKVISVPTVRVQRPADGNSTAAAQ